MGGVFGIVRVALFVMSNAENGDGSSGRHSGGNKKLTSEQQEKQVQRLTYIKGKEPVRDPFPVCPCIQVPQSKIDKLVERLYTQSLLRRENKKKELNEKFYSIPKVPKLTGDQLHDSVKRQYEQEIEKRKQRREEMRNKEEIRRKEVRKIPVSEFVQRMYFDRIEKKKKTEQVLYERYILPTEIQQVCLSKKRLEEASSRLSTKEK